MKKILLFLSLLALVFWNHWWTTQGKIATLIQTTPHPPGVDSDYLAELMNLSLDKSTDLSLTTLRDKLLKSPVIAQATVERLTRDTLFVDYGLREPIARLEDFEEALLDREGTLLPARPFYSPKRLPALYLGLATTPSWGEQLPLSESLELLSHLTLLARSHGLNVERLDLSRWQDITLILKQGAQLLYLRLPPENPKAAFAHFLHLLCRCETLPTQVDLRLENLAFVAFQPM